MRPLLAFPTLLLSLLLAGCASGPEREPMRPADTPERPRIEELLLRSQAPSGILFAVYEDDEEALRWLLPRVEWYAWRLKRRWPALPIAVVALGDEIAGLGLRHPDAGIRQIARRLVRRRGVSIHVCGAHAAMLGLSPEDFPEEIDVVPWGPALLQDYNDLGYVQIDMELVW